jgi:hypothetical protein
MNVEEIEKPQAVDKDVAGLNIEMISEKGVEIWRTTAEKEQFGF